MNGASAAMWPALQVMIPSNSCRPGGLSNDSAENLGGLYVSREDTLFGVDSDPGRSISRDKVLPAARRFRCCSITAKCGCSARECNLTACQS
jgi:hypothetical protein